jgi:hypothetical protein
MTTVNSREVVDQVIADDGWDEPGNPHSMRCVKIVQYNNQFNGGIAYGLIWEGMDLMSYHNAPACHNPVTIWELGQV